MKLVLGILLSFLPFFHLLNAQQFVFLPEKDLDTTVSANSYSFHTISMENATNDELTLVWERVSMDLPADWSVDLCDYISCYYGIPEGGTMSPIEDTLQGFLRITLNPNGKPGTGSVVFRVYNTGNPEFADTCSFSIHATQLTELNQASTGPSLIMYPVPASEILYLRNLPDEARVIEVYNLQGQRLLNESISNTRNTKLNVSELPIGIYQVLVTDNRKVLKNERILIQ